MNRLQAPRILVVEDEALIAVEIAAQLRSLGFSVLGPVGCLEEAIEMAWHSALHGALLDVNIKGGEVFPVAEILLRRGLPIVFATGRGPEHYPEQFRSKTWLRKPFNLRQLERAARRNFLDAVAGASNDCR